MRERSNFFGGIRMTEKIMKKCVAYQWKVEIETLKGILLRHILFSKILDAC
jgi:hypothetical protein